MRQQQTELSSQQNNPLPVLGVKVPNHGTLNARLREKLISLSETTPDAITHSAYGRSYFQNKWLSKPGLHEDSDPDFQTLVKFVEETANREIRKPDPAMVLRTTSMWAIVSRSGLEGRPHNHKGRVSGAYYVDAGSSGPENGGEILFFTKPGTGAQPSHSIRPESGLLLLFPSGLMHTVRRYTGPEPRIVISLNLK